MRKLPLFIAAAAFTLSLAGAPMTSHAAMVRVGSIGNGVSGYTTNCNFGQNGMSGLAASLYGQNTGGKSSGNGQSLLGGVSCGNGQNGFGGANCGNGQNGFGDVSCGNGQNGFGGVGCGNGQNGLGGANCGNGQGCFDGANCGNGQGCTGNEACNSGQSYGISQALKNVLGR